MGKRASLETFTEVTFPTVDGNDIGRTVFSAWQPASPRGQPW